MMHRTRSSAPAGIYVLPGMGADSTMFKSEWRTLEGCKLLDWPRYHGETTLREIAERVISQAEVPDGSTLVGHSLGGMVACEIAKLINLTGLVLIGSARNRDEVGGLLAALHPLATFTPFRLAQAAARMLPGDPYHMFARSDPDFIRATCRAIFKWDGMDESRILPKRIHGKHDRVIPLPANVDLILDGGHMIPITHATECVAFLKSML